MSFYRARATDGSHVRLGRVARQIDPSAIDCHTSGFLGCDYIGRHIKTGAPMFLEFKDPEQPAWARKLTANEVKMRDLYPDNWRLCLTEDDVRSALGLDVPVEFKPADLSSLARRMRRRG